MQCGIGKNLLCPPLFFASWCTAPSSANRPRFWKFLSGLSNQSTYSYTVALFCCSCRAVRFISTGRPSVCLSCLFVILCDGLSCLVYVSLDSIFSQRFFPGGLSVRFINRTESCSNPFVFMFVAKILSDFELKKDKTEKYPIRNVTFHTLIQNTFLPVQIFHVININS